MISDSSYVLLLSVDTNTKGNTHWFYFKIANWQRGKTYYFQIVNLSRDLSKFYTKGMKIVTRYETKSGQKSEWKCDPHLTEVEEFIQ